MLIHAAVMHKRLLIPINPIVLGISRTKSKQQLLNARNFASTANKVTKERPSSPFVNVAWAALTLYLGVQIVQNKHQYLAEKEVWHSETEERIKAYMHESLFTSDWSKTILKNLKVPRDSSSIKQLEDGIMEGVERAFKHLMDEMKASNPNTVAAPSMTNTPKPLPQQAVSVPVSIPEGSGSRMV